MQPNLSNKKNGQDKIENFSQEDVQNGCHLACSSINWINTFLLLIIIALLYQYLK